MENETQEVIRALAELDASKKPGSGIHGQILGMEPYIIRTNGFGLACLYDAVYLLQKQSGVIADLKAEREIKGEVK